MVDEPDDLVEPASGAPDPAQGLGDRVVEDPPARRPFAPAQHPDAMALLGKVDELEVEPERADERLGPGQVERVELRRQPRPLGGILGPAERDRPAPDALDELEQVQPLLLDDDLPEQRAEQADLAGERVAGTGRPDPARLAADGRVRAGRHRLLRRSGPATIRIAGLREV